MMLTVLLLLAPLLMTMPAVSDKFNYFRHQIETSDELVEGRNVTIACSAISDPAPTLEWYPQQDSPNQTEINENGIVTTKIQRIITLSDKHDGLEITCIMKIASSRSTLTSEQNLIINVSYSPRNTSLVISPTGPVSVGSMVNLTCSCRGNPPVHFFWFMVSDSRLEQISADTKVYSFSVTNSDRGRVFHCGCENRVGWEISSGCPLIFGDDQKSVDVHVILKILGITMLISILVIFECWIRSKHAAKPVKDGAEHNYVNRVIMVQVS